MKTIQFTCVRCNQPVYRLGKKVNLSAKTCGNCRGKSREYTARDGSSNIPVTPDGQLNTKQHNIQRIKYYQLRINKVKQLIEAYPNESFITLWKQTA